MTESRIWLIGGTKESAELAESLAGQGFACLVSVTTPSARHMYGLDIPIYVGAISAVDMAPWLEQRQIAAIVDASHPFAVEVSQGAIAAAGQLRLPYLRFERARAESPDSLAALTRPEEGGEENPNTNIHIHTVPNLNALLSPERLVGQRTLLVLGYRMLHQFKPWQQNAQLFARILPSQTALAAALKAGFTPNRLMALRPPISQDLEASLWQNWGITQVIAKASGAYGGEVTKRQVAASLGVPLWLIERPHVDYPRQTQRVEEVLEFAREHQPDAD